MKLHRFFIEQPLGEELVVKEKSLLHQWNNVLKFKKGESLILFNADKNIDYIYTLDKQSKGECVLTLERKRANLSQQEEGREVNLCISLIKKDNLDLILEKCTEIGITVFTPIISDRVEKKNIASWNKERGEKIIREAVEQSGWGNIPKLNSSIKLEDLLKDLERNNEIKDVLVMDIIPTLKQIPNEIVKNTHLLIGPEGGWTEKERELFNKYNLNTISLGKNTLRAETAAILGSYKIIQK